MAAMTPGNGQPYPEIQIHATEVGPGWILFEVGDGSPGDRPVGYWLHQAMAEWFQAHPTFRPRTTLPIVAGGETIAAHVWFDEGA